MAPKYSSLFTLLTAAVAVSASADIFAAGDERLSCPKCDGIIYSAYNGVPFLIECPDVYEKPHHDKPDVYEKPHHDKPDVYEKPHHDKPDVYEKPHHDKPDVYEKPHHDKPDVYEKPHHNKLTARADPFDVENFEECIDKCSKVETCEIASYTPFGRNEGGDCVLRAEGDPDVPEAWDAIRLSGPDPTETVTDTASETATETDSTTATQSGMTTVTMPDPTTTESTVTGLPTGLPEIPQICLTTLPGNPLPEECTQVCLDFLAIPGAPLPEFCVLIPSLSLSLPTLPTTVELPTVTGLPQVPSACLANLPGPLLPAQCLTYCTSLLAIPEANIPAFCLTIPGFTLPTPAAGAGSQNRRPRVHGQNRA